MNLVKIVGLATLLAFSLRVSANEAAKSELVATNSTYAGAAFQEANALLHLKSLDGDQQQRFVALLHSSCADECTSTLGQSCHLLALLYERGWSGQGIREDHWGAVESEFLTQKSESEGKDSSDPDSPAPRTFLKRSAPHRSDSYARLPFPPLPHRPAGLFGWLQHWAMRLVTAVHAAAERILRWTLGADMSATLLLPPTDDWLSGRTDINYVLAPNFTHAMQLHRQAAECGNAASHFAIGVMYAYGIGGVRQSDAKALLHYHAAAAGGDQEAAITLGYRHEDGIGVPVSCSAASQYYEQAAHTAAEAIEVSFGLVQATPPAPWMRLDDGFLANVGWTWRRDVMSDSQSVAYYHNLADKGDLNAHVALGHMYLLGFQLVPQDFLIASEHFHAAGEEGELVSLVCLAFMYLHGLGVERDAVLAREFLQEPLQHNFPAAMNLQGYMYLHGIGEEQDLSKAFTLFTQAAAASSADALFNLGMMHLTGIVPKADKDFRKAYASFQSAADQGHLRAIYYVGLMNAHGIGTKRDCQSAVRSFKDMLQRMQVSIPMKNGFRALARGNKLTALFEFLRAAEQGLEPAQWNAAFMLERGHISNASRLAAPEEDAFVSVHTLRNNSTGKNALHWLLAPSHNPGAVARRLSLLLLQRSASQGSGVAHLLLGHYFLDGAAGLNASFQQASSLYLTACTQHISEACFALGAMADFGVLTNQDDFLAKRYYDLTLEYDHHRTALAPASLMLLRMNLRHQVVNFLEPLLQELGVSFLVDNAAVRFVLGTKQSAAQVNIETAAPPTPEDASTSASPSPVPSPTPDARARLEQVYETVRLKRERRRQSEDLFANLLSDAPQSLQNVASAVVHAGGHLLGISTVESLSHEESLLVLCVLSVVVIVLFRTVRRPRAPAAQAAPDR